MSAGTLPNPGKLLSLSELKRSCHNARRLQEAVTGLQRESRFTCGTLLWLVVFNVFSVPFLFC